MLDVYVIGAGGFAREVAHICVTYGDALGVNFRGYIGQREEVGRTLRFGAVVFDDEAAAQELPRSAGLVCGLGTPAWRQKTTDYFRGKGFVEFPNVIHPRAFVNQACNVIGQGNVIMAGASMTVDITLGDFCIVNLGVMIGHDVVVGDCCALNPGANLSGCVHLGRRVMIGSSAAVLEGLEVADDVVLGSGAVLTRSISTRGAVYAGVPATPLTKSPAA